MDFGWILGEEAVLESFLRVSFFPFLFGSVEIWCDLNKDTSNGLLDLAIHHQ